MGNGDEDDTNQSHSVDGLQNGHTVEEVVNDVHGDSPQQDVMPKLADGCPDPDCENEVCELEMKPLVSQVVDTAPPLDSVTDDQNPGKVKTDDEGNDDGEKKGVQIVEDNSHLLQDRGWAWFVCAACCIAHFLTGGMERSDGVLFLEFTDKFQQGAQISAWPGSICSFFRLMMGPAATAMCNRFSVRATVMTGALIFAVALIITGFAPNIIFLYFSFGVLQGIGRGLVYAPVTVAVGLYFDRHRGLGVGLGTAGVGVGTFLMPPIVDLLFQEFGFQGAFLILGGVVLNCCVVAALIRPFFVHRNIVLGRRRFYNDAEVAVCSTGQNDSVKAQDGEDATVKILSNAQSGHPEISTDEQQKLTTESSNAKPTSIREYPRKNKARKTVFFKSVFDVCFPTEEQRKDGPKRKLIEWSLLRNHSFLFYCFSIFLFTAAFKSAFTFLPALAKSQGLSATKATYLLSISGVMDTTGRILAGFILDIKHIKPVRPIIYNAVIFIIMGLSFLSPYLTSFVEFAVLFGLYGMLTGTYVSQKSVILVDILGQEKLSSSFGLLICFQSIGSLIGPPLSGLLKDIQGRFHEAFFMGGAAMAVAGVLMVVSNVHRVKQNRRASHKEVTLSQEDSDA